MIEFDSVSAFFMISLRILGFSYQISNSLSQIRNSRLDFRDFSPFSKDFSPNFACVFPNSSILRFYLRIFPAKTAIFF